MEEAEARKAAGQLRRLIDLKLHAVKYTVHVEKRKLDTRSHIVVNNTDDTYYGNVLDTIHDFVKANGYVWYYYSSKGICIYNAYETRKVNE